MNRTLSLSLAAFWTVGILVMVAIPPPEVPQSPDIQLDKVAHFGAFFLFAWLWMAAGTTPRTWLWVLITGLIYATGTEFIQDLLPVARHPDPIDALANAGGVLSGIYLHQLWARFRPASSADSGAG